MNPASDIDDLIGLLPQMSAEDRAEFDKFIPPPPPSFADPKFPHQAAFINDPARFKGIIGPRRMGKSSSLVRVLVSRGWEDPLGMSLYIGLTLPAARKAVWDGPGGFKTLNTNLSLGLKFNESDSIVTLPNGHKIFIIGMDANQNLKDRVRGGSYKTVVVDEAATFVMMLDSIFSDVLRSAVADKRGTICIAGTPGIIKRGLFFDVTNKEKQARAIRWTVDHPGTASKWSVHRWTGHENPGMAKELADDERDMIAVNPLIVETPSFMREARGLWVLDDSKLVYRFNQDRNTYTDFPLFQGGRWRYVLVVDLGYFPDPSSFTVCCYHEHCRTMFVPEATQRLRLDITGVANVVKNQYMTRYSFDALVIDNANVQAVEEMRARHGLGWIPAQKTGKADFIELLNSDAVSGYIKINEKGCSWEKEPGMKAGSLMEEMTDLVWDERKFGLGIREESSACSNHSCFAADTPIATEHGPVLIADVCVGMRVWTRSGLRAVTDIGCVGIRPVVTALVSDGRTITGTSDHPVWTKENGWVELHSLLPSYSIASIQQEATCGDATNFNGAGSLGTDIQTPRTCQIESIGPALPPERQTQTLRADYTGLSGSPHTDQSRPNTTSTTPMTTGTTTTSRTSNANSDSTISQSTCSPPNVASSLEKTSDTQSQPPPSGTAPVRVARGMLSTLVKYFRIAIRWIISALSAARCSARKARSQTFAVVVALPNSAETVASTTSTSPASNAESSFDATDTANRPSAAPFHVLAVVANDYAEPVFNLTVEGEHEFFANGILVSNCDGLLYGWRYCYNYMASVIAPKHPVGTPEWAQAEEKALELAAVNRYRREQSQDQDMPQWPKDDWG